jgi:hypothetical protein
MAQFVRAEHFDQTDAEREEQLKRTDTCCLRRPMVNRKSKSTTFRTLDRCVPSSKTRLRRRWTSFFDFSPLIIAELKTGCRQIFFQMLDSRCAGNRQHHRRVMNQPGNRNLSVGCAVPLRGSGKRCARGVAGNVSAMCTEAGESQNG